VSPDSAPTEEAPVIRKVTKERDDLQAIRPDSDESDIKKSDEETSD
jgi:hypothetical protein